MTAMPLERKDRLLIAVIGATVLLVVLAVAYLAYRALPTEGARATWTELPESRTAPPDREVEVQRAPASAVPDAGAVDSSVQDGPAPGSTPGDSPSQEQEPAPAKGRESEP